ncbi:DUF4230 domain-containing protein [Allosphingosinicella flava]|uniref:DUF4230 domain-containing protein n=1 Tax=Allosphingosinicella flava TaxID=2771430 RepID=A0A7T2GJU7_9SPHN|nr:DUF4230 domain-containing protein [Sphingosinicella flava]QPQ55198.1 DUF4230 domain-containing protein [Sphingosinicella flava]
MRRSFILVLVLAAGLILGALLTSAFRLSSLFGGGPDPETIATASLQSVREQARLTPFVARYVAVVTSTQSRFGLNAQKTMILPGTVRYEVDLAKLRRDDLEWDAAANRLNVTLPPVEVAGPEIDLAQVQEYSGGGVLMSLTNAEAALDAANRQRGTQSLLAQARAPVPMRLARNAARTAVERSFAMPLRAAGIEATVVARFADEAANADPSQLDRSRRIEDVLEESKAKK